MRGFKDVVSVAEFKAIVLSAIITHFASLHSLFLPMLFLQWRRPWACAYPDFQHIALHRHLE